MTVETRRVMLRAAAAERGRGAASGREAAQWRTTSPHRKPLCSSASFSSSAVRSAVRGGYSGDFDGNDARRICAAGRSRATAGRARRLTPEIMLAADTGEGRVLFSAGGFKKCRSEI